MARRILIASLIAAAIGVGLGAQRGDQQISGAPAEPWPDAAANIQKFVRDALADRLKAGNIPDLDLRAGQNRTLNIRREITRDRKRLSDEALPRLDGFTLTLRTLPELQAETDRTNRSPMFIIVNSVGLAEESGTIDMGTDVLLPTNSRQIKLCCCVARGTFARSTAGWTFQSWSNFVCS